MTDLLPPELEKLFAAERDIESLDASKARVFERLSKAIPGLPALDSLDIPDVDPGLGNADPAGAAIGSAAGNVAEISAAKGAAAVVTQSAALKMGLAAAAAAFAIGNFSGAGLQKKLGQPKTKMVEKLVYVDRIVEKPVEKIVEVVVPAADPTAKPSKRSKPKTTTAKIAEASSDKGIATPFQRERAMIDAARAALGSGNTKGASEVLRRHQREFPSGKLREERDALGIMALTQQGRIDEASARYERFRKQHPNSLMQGAIERGFKRMKKTADVPDS